MFTIKRKELYRREAQNGEDEKQRKIKLRDTVYVGWICWPKAHIGPAFNGWRFSQNRPSRLPVSWDHKTQFANGSMWTPTDE